MTNLEHRLRTELVELADVLLDDQETPFGSIPQDLDNEFVIPTPHEARPASRSTPWRLAAVVVSVLTVVGLAYLSVENTNSEEIVLVDATADAPSSFGTWDTIAEAPIDPRPYAVTAWTGSEVVFWAGSNLARNFAYSDGASYDPVTDSWDTTAVPGWGHPGLTSAFFDGEIFAVAKGSANRFDPIAGESQGLLPVEGMVLAAIVATDNAIWGVGPANLDNVGQRNIAIARYEPASNTWVYGPVFQGTSDESESVAALSLFGSTPIWTGTEIMVWPGSDASIAFDPATETWRTMPHLQSPSGLILGTVAVELDDGMAILAEVETQDGTKVNVAILRETGWQWRETNIAISNFPTVTAAAAGEWLVVFSADQSPAVIHLPSGAWHRGTQGPLAGTRAPNTAWTGNELIVWGGVQDDTDTPNGAKWTPPD